MTTTAWILLGLGLVVGTLSVGCFIRWGIRWGATDQELAEPMTGDAYLEGGPATRVRMTRAVTIDATAAVVWPWLAQIGRGAGWYSIDWLDNRGRTSARHIVSWIPEPQRGDAAAIGYLRHLEPGRELVWWVKGERLPGSTTRLVIDILLLPREQQSRLVIRISGDASGLTAPLVLVLFQFIDSIMARRQLLGIKSRVERYADRREDPENPETGARDQYQLYEAIYTSGQRAGVPGKEKAALWQQAAIDDGLI